MPTTTAQEKPVTIIEGVTDMLCCKRLAMASQKPMPVKIPITPPAMVTTTLSTRNCAAMWRGEAPRALRVPTSRTRSLKEASRMFMITMPPTRSEMVPHTMKVTS